jgi:hypothetical protein
VNNELENIYNEVVVAYFNILKQDMELRTIMKYLTSDGQSPGRYLNPGTPANEAGMPTTEGYDQ